jgi:hypothetical protein
LTASLGETNTDDRHDIQEEPGSQYDFTQVVDDTQTPQTPMINLFDPALWPKIRDRTMLDHLILHDPRRVRLRITFRMKMVVISQIAIISVNLRTTNLSRVDG